MKYKIPQLMCFLLAIILIVSPINTKAKTVTESGQQGVSVKASIEPSFVVSLPANIELKKSGNTATCTKKIGVKGDIQVSGSVSVEASPNFTMFDVSLRPAGDTTTPSIEDDQNGYPHKDPVRATSTQAAIIWPYAELSQLSAGEGFTYDGGSGFHNTDMSIEVTNFTAGKWEGLVNFDISYDDGLAPTVVALTLGETYQFGGYEWVAAEQHEGYVTLQSTGVTGGAWPGYKMTGNLTNAAGDMITLTEGNTVYTANIDGYDISDYDIKTTALYNSIKPAEYSSASYGKGLFLVSNEKVGTTTAFEQGSGNYWTALKTATANYSSFGANNNWSWIGTVNGDRFAWLVLQNGDVSSNVIQNNSCVIAPAFNLDLSKVTVSGNTITIN